jgi:hypothetical protein
MAGCCWRLQARAVLGEPLRRVTSNDMFADSPGAPQPLLRTLLRKALHGHDLPELAHVGSCTRSHGMAATSSVDAQLSRTASVPLPPATCRWQHMTR